MHPKPTPASGRHRTHHIQVLIRQLHAQPRQLRWIVAKAQETGFDANFLREALVEFNDGTTIEQLRAQRTSLTVWQKIWLQHKADQQIKAALVQFVIKSGNLDFLKMIRTAGWLGWFATVRLNAYCARLARQKRPTPFTRKPFVRAA